MERATVPVEKIRGPVLLVSGMDDQMWPSSVLADIATRRLEAHDFPFPFQHLCYEGAGHTIKVPYGPLTVRVSALGKRYSGMLYSQGGTAEADAEAGADAWRKQSVFLRDAVEGRA